MGDGPQSAAATFCATLVDEWVRGGVTDAVVAPGSRSTPLALALDERLRVQVHVDERAAGFWALGVGAATGRPAVVLTTSGTAAVELHPAVVEASYGRVPLLAATADRPPELHGVGAPQTIDQRGLYGSAVRACLDPGVPTWRDQVRWRSVARGALGAALGPPAGPVQLNLAFAEPLTGSAGPLPAAEVPPAGGGTAAVDPTVLEALAERLAQRSGLVVAGGGIEDPDAVLALGAHLGWPVVADPRSGCRVPGAVAHADLWLRATDLADEAPEVVLRLGHPPASKVLAGWLGGLEVPQVGVDADGWRFDPEGALQEVVAGPPGAVCSGLRDRLDPPHGDPWLAERWRALDEAAAAAIGRVLAAETRPSGPAVARAVVGALPEGATLVVASSLPVREVEWYAPARRGLRVLANRGANGIDGVVSTARGVAASGGPTAALVGDLAFLHDTNALLGASAGEERLTVVVADNDGGGIFSFLPQAAELDERRFERLFGTPHGLDLVAVARAHGVAAQRVEDLGELAALLGEDPPGLRVLVVPVDRAETVAVQRRLVEATAAAVGDV